MLARESDLIFSLEAPDGHLPGFLDTSLVAFDSYDGFMYSFSLGKPVTGTRSLVSDFFNRTCLE